MPWMQPTYYLKYMLPLTLTLDPYALTVLSCHCFYCRVLTALVMVTPATTRSAAVMQMMTLLLISPFCL